MDTNGHESKWKAVFSSAHVEWGTPPDLKAALEAEFHFTLDPCTPGQVWDGCAISWAGHRVFCNPPYGRTIGNWLAKGREADLAVFLIPSQTNTT
jgi:site-specific DNA-methyltransferase (adenine-specific)